MSIFKSTLIICLAISTTVSAANINSLGIGQDRKKLSSDPQKISTQKDPNAQENLPTSQKEKKEAKQGRIHLEDIEHLKTEKKLGKALDQEINYMESFLKKIPAKSKNPQRPLVLQRLIENYHQRALIISFEESRYYESQWDKWNQGKRQGTEPKMPASRGVRYLDKIVYSGNEFIKTYPKQKGIDRVYFQLAYALDQQNKKPLAISYYQALIKKFPNSEFVPEAYFALGEYDFDKADYRKAIAWYQQVTRFNRSPIYPWAIYKTGWAYFNIQQYEKSLRAFQQVVEISQYSQAATQSARLRMKEEALRDMVNVWAELGRIDEAEQYFARVGGSKYYGDLLMRFASILRERGQYDQSIALLKKFNVHNKADKDKSLEIQFLIIDTAFMKADKAVLWRELTYLFDNFGPATEWFKNSKDKESKDKIKKVALYYPKKIHSEAQLKKSKYQYSQAEIGYKIYLRYFADAPEAAQVRFHLGELEYTNEKYLQASQTFLALCQLGTKTPYFQKSSDYLLSSAYLPIQNGMKVLSKKPVSLTKAPEPIAAPYQNYMKVCDQYTQWFPNSPYVFDCLRDSTEIYLKHSQFTEAEKRLRIISTKYVSKPQGKSAAELLLLLNSKDKKKLYQEALALSKIPEYRTGTLGQRIMAILESKKFEDTQDLEKNGKYLEAAKGFESIATTNPKGPDADKAWYNAGLNYKKAGEADKSLFCLSQLISQYPKSTLLGEGLLQTIQIYEDSLQFQGAMQASATFVNKYPKDSRSAVLTKGTCFLASAAKDPINLEKACRPLLKNRATAPAAADAMVSTYLQMGRYQNLGTFLERDMGLLPPSDQLIYFSKTAKLENKLGLSSKARYHENSVLRIYKDNPKRLSAFAISEVARIQVSRLKPQVDKIQSIRLTAMRKDGSDLQSSIENKQRLIKGLESKCNEIISLGDPQWTIASLSYLGNAYEQLSTDLKTAPLPPNTPPATATQLKASFDKLSQGPASKATGLYDQGMKIMEKNAVFTDVSRKLSDSYYRIKNQPGAIDWSPNSLYVSTPWMEIPETQGALKSLQGGAQ